MFICPADSRSYREGLPPSTCGGVVSTLWTLYSALPRQREAGGKGASEQGEATPFPLPWNEVEQGSESPTLKLVAFIELGPESPTQCPPCSRSDFGVSAQSNAERSRRSLLPAPCLFVVNCDHQTAPAFGRSSLHRHGFAKSSGLI
jgi:hypothetical protein